jgi:hypothetical protein
MLKNVDWDRIILILFATSMFAAWLYFAMWLGPKLGLRT